MRKHLLLAATTLALAALGAPANAAAIIGIGDPLSDPALSGGSQIQFNQLGTFTTLSEPGVTITGPLRVTAEYANQYNTFGSSLDNNRGATSLLTFSFAQPLSAFAFNYGASDRPATLSAFSGGTLLETLTLPETRGNNDKAFFGLSGSNITSATLTTSGGDYIFVDNLTFATASVSAVPEPATWAMMIGGFGMVGGAMRSARRTQKVTVSYA